MASPWPHQIAAVEFARGLPGVGIDAWMGTGKTLIGFLLLEDRVVRRALVLAPLSVISVWRDKAVEYRAAGLVAYDWLVVPLDDRSGTARDKAARVRGAAQRADLSSRPLLVVANYESAWREPLASTLREIGFEALVLDESHRIKSPTGSASKWVGRLAATIPFRAALTGTPMPHSPLDVFAQMRAIDPSIFGLSFVRFRAEYAIVDASAGFPRIMGMQRQEQLSKLLARTWFHVDRSVLRLPPAMHHRVPVALDAEGRRVYDELEENARAKVADGTITPANAGVLLLRLQQVTGGHVGVDVDDWGGERESRRVGSEKKERLVELLDGVPADEPFVVFARFRADLEEIHDAARSLDRKSLELSGSRRELARWQAGEAPILAVQVQSGGVGIDLTRACYCALFSLGFSLGDYEQILARVHRPGQTRTTHYYHLVAKSTVDEAVYGSMRKKKDVIASVLEGMLRAKGSERWTPQEA